MGNWAEAPEGDGLSSRSCVCLLPVQIHVALQPFFHYEAGLTKRHVKFEEEEKMYVRAAHAVAYGLVVTKAWYRALWKAGKVSFQNCTHLTA
eukprot:4187385-Amphidinium_carterae.1